MDCAALARQVVARAQGCGAKLEAVFFRDYVTTYCPEEQTGGQVLKVMATDPGSVKDFQAFCKQTGNELLSHSEGPEFTFFMKKR